MEALWQTIDTLLGVSATKAEELTIGQAGLPEGGCGLHRANRLRAVRQKAFYRPGYSL